LGAAKARAWGAEAILVGEALMRASGPEATTRELAHAPGGGPIHEFFHATGRPFIKICGLTLPEQLAHLERLCTAHLCSDAFGLVFAPSRRRVTLEQAKKIVNVVGKARGMRAVGVFVNEAPTAINDLVERVGLDVVQLSGDESPATCAQIRACTQKSVIKALRPSTLADVAALDAYVLAGATPLLDTPSSSHAY